MGTNNQDSPVKDSVDNYIQEPELPVNQNDGTLIDETEVPDWVNTIVPAESQSVPARNYLCPNCEGEFNHWDVNIVDGEEEWVCPHCSMVRGSYEPEKQ